ncbi:MAG: hypothetical protein BroJett014_15090 [Planctomycetota bacterium]|nr:MAG: hypothetical protein BroJett014_15090 [Planctomycetota bacterium]HRJ78527.1 hypothetical protein [Planctomycetota bacterium]
MSGTEGFVREPEYGQYVLAFLIAPEAPGGGFTGALLVTDSRTRPLEFVSAAPVRPTKIQTYLYGKTLREHATIDVIARKLVASVSHRPVVIFVDSEELLDVGRIVKVPVAMLTASGSIALSGSTPLSQVKFKVSEASKDGETAVGTLVGELEQTIDLLEPFKRTAEALKEALKAGG